MAQINKPSEYFNTVLYTGTGSSGNAITGVGFQPDFLWIKNRTSISGHVLMDVIRGISSGLSSNGTNAENIGSYLNSFDTDGFNIAATGVAMNSSGNNFASWNWLANGAGSANTDGSISSTVSANTTSGFSIVSFTAPASGNFTVGHGLSSPPEMIIIKNRDISQAWYVLHKDLSSFTDRYLILHGTSAEITYSMMSQTPSNSLLYLTVGATADANNNHIIYCFNSVKGYSKFGSYTGNGSADGTFVYTGFKPAFCIIKRTDSAGYSWATYDSTRYPENKSTIPALWSNLSDAEGSYSTIDFLSNGFKIRETSATINASGGTYIYMAFAENPLVGTNNIPTTAR